MTNVFRMLIFAFFAIGLSAVEITPPSEPPLYPESARREGMQGDVTLDIRFSSYGSIISISRQSQFGILGRQAKSEVWKWHFSNPKPGRTIRVIFHYRLDDSVQKTTVRRSNHNREVTITAPTFNTQLHGISFR